MTEYLTIRDIFMQLGVGEWVIRRAIAKGELKTVTVSRKLFPQERTKIGLPTEVMAVHRDEFERYLSGRNKACSGI